MYHKLTVYVKSRYQTNLFPSCCFGDQYHKYEHHSINTLQISFIFYTLSITTCFMDARHGFNIIFNTFSARWCNLICGTNLQKIHVFISLGKKTMPCFHLYAYTEQNAVWCNMKARVVFFYGDLKEISKKIFDIKIKNNLFLINSKLPGMSNCIHIYSLAGYPASLGTIPLSPSLPFVPPFYPPSLGLPGFGQNICSFIAQNNSILEIHF